MENKPVENSMRILHYPGSVNVKRFDIIDLVSEINFPAQDSYVFKLRRVQ